MTHQITKISANLSNDAASVVRLNMLIREFEKVDLQLRQALETEDNSHILDCQEKADLLIAELISFKCNRPEGTRKLMRFLVGRFVLDGDHNNSLCRRVCDRLISMI